MIFLGDFAAFYLIPMLVYMFLYTRIAFTLKASNHMVKHTKTSSSEAPTAQKRFSRVSSPNPASTLDGGNHATNVSKDAADPEQGRRYSMPEASLNRLSSIDSNGEVGAAERSVLRANNHLYPKTSLQIPPSHSANQISTVSTVPIPRDTFVTGGRQTSAKGRNQVGMLIKSAACKETPFQVVKMLAVIVAVFAVCWLPYRAMVMYNSFATSKWDPDW